MLGAFKLSTRYRLREGKNRGYSPECAIRERPCFTRESRNCLGHRLPAFYATAGIFRLDRSSRYQLSRDSTNAYSSKRGLRSSADLVSDRFQSSFPIDAIQLSVLTTLANSTRIRKYLTSSSSCQRCSFIMIVC